jgi:hypothetical protein
MNKVTNALKRKWGPLPAWAWLLIGAVLVYYYRSRFTSTSSSGTGTGSVVPSSPTPGTGEQVLQPGESIYDPTAGTLQTAPGGGSSFGGGGSGDPTQAAADLGASMDNLANAIAQGMPPTQVQVTIPGTATPGTSGSGKGNKNKKKVTGRISDRGPWKSVGKSKGQDNSRGKHKPSKTRGPAAVRNPHGGRTGGRQPSRATGGVGLPGRSQGKPAASRARQRPKTPAVQAVIRQRTQATHPAPKPAASAPHVATRPSAPAPRTVRAPARPAPHPAPRPRKK